MNEKFSSSHAQITSEKNVHKIFYFSYICLTKLTELSTSNLGYFSVEKVYTYDV